MRLAEKIYNDERLRRLTLDIFIHHFKYDWFEEFLKGVEHRGIPWERQTKVAMAAAFREIDMIFLCHAYV